MVRGQGAGVRPGPGPHGVPRARRNCDVGGTPGAAGRHGHTVWGEVDGEASGAITAWRWWLAAVVARPQHTLASGRRCATICQCGATPRSPRRFSPWPARIARSRRATPTAMSYSTTRCRTRHAHLPPNTLVQPDEPPFRCAGFATSHPRRTGPAPSCEVSAAQRSHCCRSA